MLARRESSLFEARVGLGLQYRTGGFLALCLGDKDLRSVAHPQEPNLFCWTLLDAMGSCSSLYPFPVIADHKGELLLIS